MSPCARGVRKIAAAQTSGLANLVLSCQTGFFECEHPFIDNRARCRKHTAIRPGFETISKQHAARAQHRSYSIHTESFSSTLEYAKFEQAKERLHMYVQLILCCRHLQNIIPR